MFNDFDTQIQSDEIASLSEIFQMEELVNVLYWEENEADWYALGGDDFNE